MSRSLATAFLVSALMFLTHCSLYSREESADNQMIERLVAMGELWGAINYFHPYLSYKDIDWDKALVNALPGAMNASDTSEYAAAVEKMLAVLNDPVTRIVNDNKEAVRDSGIQKIKEAFTIFPQPEGESHPMQRMIDKDILVITITRYEDLTDYAPARKKMVKIINMIPKANGLIFDIRASEELSPELNGYLTYIFRLSGVRSLLSSTPLSLPGYRTRMHKGFKPQMGTTSGSYISAFITWDGEQTRPSPLAKDLPVVFLINKHAELPPVALALQDAGKGAIISDGEALDSTTALTHRVNLNDELNVKFRLSEQVCKNGSFGIKPDIVINEQSGADNSDPAFKAALDLVRNFNPGDASVAKVPACGSQKLDNAHRETPYPSVELRLLAAFRIFTVINYFNPYKELMGEDWKAVLRKFIPRMIDAKDALEYHLAVSEMVTYIHDSHCFISSKVLSGYFGEAPPPFRLQIVEGLPVVVGYFDVEATKACGVEIGDVILEVDGEDAMKKVHRMANYIASSTPHSLLHKAVRSLVKGPENSTAKVKLRRGDDKVIMLDIIRTSQYWKKNLVDSRTGDIFKLITKDIGYADLDRLARNQVDEMFYKFKDTKAIIFDMRGYPKGTAWAIAPRLAKEAGRVAALFRCPVVMSPGDSYSDISKEDFRYTFLQRIPLTDKPRYTGKTVMLIDERAGSQSEHTGLFLKAANNTVFIGSPTAGVNGDVTNFLVPGGISINFTGQAVRHPDGRQLQRIGLLPDIEVRPTVVGIRSGKDEILDAAVKYLEAELKSK